MTWTASHPMLYMLPTIIHELNNRLEVTCSTSHFTAVMSALPWFYKLEWAALAIDLKRCTSMLNVIIRFEGAFFHIIAVLLYRIHPLIFINRKWTPLRITSEQFVEGALHESLIRVSQHITLSKNAVCTSCHPSQLLKWTVLHIIQSAVEIESCKNSSSRMSRTTSHSPMAIISPQQ